MGDDVCSAKWLEWGFACELEDEHPGAHMGYADGRLAYWGGSVAEWQRV